MSKSVGPPQAVLYNDDYRAATRGDLKCLLGHNRYATVGKIINENAHPFDFDTIVGAHNGNMSGSKWKMYDHRAFDTDSEAVFSNINKNGIMQTLDLVHEYQHSRDAYALVWYDKANNSINFVRNDERTLFYTYSEDECTLFWASELDMLKWILKRNNVKVHDNTYFKFTEGQHYSWKIPKSSNGKFPPPTRIKHEPPPPKVYASTFEFKPKDELNNFKYHNHAQLKLNIPPKLDTKKFRPPYKRPNGMAIKKDTISEMVKEGCMFCNDFDPTKWKWNDFLFVLKEDLCGKPLFLCEDCYNDDDIREACKEMM